MKRIIKHALFMVLLTLVVSCQKENTLPNCYIAYPFSNAEFEIGDSITISVEAEDEDGSIIEVRFYINNIGVSSVSNLPYNFQWNTSEEEAGIYKIKVTVKDDQGAIVEDEISVHLKLIEKPFVITSDITNVNVTTATTGGVIVRDGGAAITASGVCWSTYQNPTTIDSKTLDSTGTDSFTSSVTGLNSKTTYYVRAYATNTVGTAYGNEVSFTTPEGTFTDSRDNNEYNYIALGDQVWMAGNLAWLPSVSEPSSGSHTEPYYYVYGYSGTSVSSAKATVNYGKFGVLYNWTAALTACPLGWHLPTDAEWTVLENYLITSGYNYDGTTSENKIAKALASARGWHSSTGEGAPGNADYPEKRNATGFSALPGGHLLRTGSYYYAADLEGYFWSETESNSGEAWWRVLKFNSSNVVRKDHFKSSGYSVRCIRDN